MIMSANVRRLVFDLTPLWRAYVLFQLAVTLMIDGIWLSGSSTNIPLIAAMFTANATAMVTGKQPVWSLLPVSRTERGRANWWYLIGAPMLFLAAALPALALILNLFGQLRVARSAVLALAAGQMAVVGSVGGVALMAGAVRDRVGQQVATGFSLIGIALVLCMFVFWRHVAPADWIRMIAAGALALVVAAVLYLNAGRLSLLTAASVQTKGRASRAGTSQPAAAPRTVRAKARSGPMWGWLESTANLLWLFSLFVLAMLGAILYAATAGSATWREIAPPYVPILGLYCVLMYDFRLSIRTLRGLPLSGPQLTMVLNLTQVAILAAITLPLAIVCAALGLSLAGLLEALVVCVVACAITLPILLRFGQRGLLVVMGIGSGVAPAIAISLSADGAPAPPGWLGPVLLGAATILMIGGWIWSHHEIARGRAALRARPMAPVRWRGA